MTKTTSDGKQRLTLFVKSLIVKQARAQAVVEELTLSTLVEKSLIGYLPKITFVKKAEI